MKYLEYKLINWDNFEVVKRIEHSNLIVLLLKVNWHIVPPKEGRKNLIAIDNDENIRWIADLPKVPYSSYHDVNIINGKIMGVCSSFLCEIDDKTGKIFNETFIK